MGVIPHSIDAPTGRQGCRDSASLAVPHSNALESLLKGLVTETLAALANEAG
jgi:hypothetical protein